MMITVPFFLLLAIVAFLFVSRARRGHGSMPFGLPNMTAEQLSVFGMAYLTYVLYVSVKAAQAFFISSGGKTSVLDS